MQLSLGEFEQLVLLAVMRLGEDAYGITVRRELDERAGRSVSLGTVYKTLERLESKGCLTSRTTDPVAERGGRRKKVFQASALGVQALRASMASLQRMAEGLEEHWQVR